MDYGLWIMSAVAEWIMELRIEIWDLYNSGGIRYSLFEIREPELVIRNFVHSNESNILRHTGVET